MTDSQSSDYACSLLSLPFYQSTDDEFMSIINNVPLSNAQNNLADNNVLSFNVFDVEDCDSVNPLSAMDPDNNFFNTVFDSDLVTSSYYNESTFNTMYDNLNCISPMSFLHLNLRSVTKNINSLENYLPLLDLNFKFLH